MSRVDWGHVASAVLVGVLAGALVRVGGQLQATPSVLAGAVAAVVWAALTWAMRHGAGTRPWPEPPEPGRMASFPHVAIITRRLEREARDGPTHRTRPLTIEEER